MFERRRISSLEDPALAPYRTMRDQFRHREQRIFVAEGDKVVQRLLESACEVISVVMPSKWIPQFEPLLAARPERIVLYEAEKEVLEQITGFQFYQGVMALGRVPELARMEDLVRTSNSENGLVVAADGLTSAQNVGTLVRTAGAFGVQGYIGGETSVSPYVRRAVRSSMGAVFRMPVVESQNLIESLHFLRARGFCCVAADPHGDQQRLSQVDLTRDVCIVLGSEGEGIRSEVLQECDIAVGVPMANGVDSLNVGSAGAVFLYEARRQRSG